MRVAAVVICLWSRYGGRKPFYAVEWGNDRLCREMADTVIRMNSGRIVETLHNARPKTAYEIAY